MNKIINPFEKTIGIQGVFALKIYNSFGQLVYSNEKSSNQVQLDLPAGIYYLDLKQNETNISFTTKLIKN